jgi:membrane protein YqaA with SNARE-associated domain
MWTYAAVFLSAFVFDVIPLIAPPAWTAMLFLLVKFHLNPWLVVPVGVAGSTLGRYVTSLYMPKFAHKFVHRNKQDDLKFLGRKLSQKLWQSWLFVFLYTITPLSSTALFLAAGVAKVKPLSLIPPFFCGKILSDTAMILWGRYAVADVESILQGTYSMKGILTIVLGLVAVGGFLVIDWRSLLQRKKFKLNFKIWK